MKKLALIINPIAGMGGSVGLKGTDGVGILQMAIERGAEPKAEAKVEKALSKLLEHKDEIFFYTGSASLGEDLLKNMGFKYEVSYRSEAKNQTSADDTISAARSFVEKDVDLIIFAGGDGTARNIFEAIGENYPSLGIPAGVKIHSAVFALSPKMAGEAILDFLFQNGSVMQKDVMDIDEDAYRQGRVMTRLYGALTTPVAKKNMQNRKAPSPLSDAAAQVSIANYLLDEMEDDCYYLIGAGSTTSALKKLLASESTVLGVDLVYKKKIVARDLSEYEILEKIKGQKVKLIVTPIGGQGFLFGRGNQQLSSHVLQEISKENIIIVATESKIVGLSRKELQFYTGDDEIDKKIEGYYRVITSYGNSIMLFVRAI